jgi:hypothetical protein
MAPMMRAGGFIGVGMAVVTSGCVDATEPSRDLSAHRAVYAVLEVGSTMVRVLAEEIHESGLRSPLEGGTAVVEGPQGATALGEGASGPGVCSSGTGSAPVQPAPGCYTGHLPQATSEGDSVRLDMTFADGSVLRGALRAPAVPVASIPPDSQRITVIYRSNASFPIAVVPVGLESAVGAYRVDILPVVESAYITGDAIDPRDCVVHASSAPFPTRSLSGEADLVIHAVRCLRADVALPWDSVDLTAQVVAMDENYAEYTTRALCSGLVSEARAGFGIEGAVGVFGAVAVAALPLRLVFEPIGGPPPTGALGPPTYPC